MKLEINIEKRYAYVIIALLIVLIGVLIVGAANVNTNKAYHPLQQISKGVGTNAMASVDSNGDGVIDSAGVLKVGVEEDYGDELGIYQTRQKVCDVLNNLDSAVQPVWGLVNLNLMCDYYCKSQNYQYGFGRGIKCDAPLSYECICL